MSEIVGPIAWSDDLEKYFKTIGEQSNGLAWLHKRAEAHYARLRNYLELPVIILGVLNGATSVGSGSLFSDPKFASIAVGLVAILGAILSTISSYFKYSARAEAHRMSSIHFSKFFRFIAVQLGLPREERLQAQDALRHIKEENDRLLEISPLLPKNIINEFKSKFASISNIAKPSDANGLEAIHIYEPGEALSSFVSPAPTRPSRPSHPIINMEELTATQPTISLETATKNRNILK